MTCRNAGFCTDAVLPREIFGGVIAGIAESLDNDALSGESTLAKCHALLLLDLHVGLRVAVVL